MGLDMYLNRETYVKQWPHEQKKHVVTVKFGGKVRKDIKPERVATVVEEVGYWRKFNALHSLIVNIIANGEDDCQPILLNTGNIEFILDVLRKVDKDHSLADELLPASEGFFFGGTDYDEYYFNNVKESIRIFEGVLSEIEQDKKERQPHLTSEYYYQASW